MRKTVSIATAFSQDTVEAQQILRWPGNAGHQNDTRELLWLPLQATKTLAC